MSTVNTRDTTGASDAMGEMVQVCRVDQVPLEGGVAALVGGRAIALFRTWEGNIYATSNYDPWSRASVMSRGIVGTRGDVPFVASPMHKQAFDLRTGRCLDDESVRLTMYDVRVLDGRVWVGGEKSVPEGEST
ncbi:nitrite reductase small subunit NirD [Nocardioides gilvus]|uniref:nitrite reductase small subunit NirD n=1 Tax=Nocardioides gilvus TaxID=1735589 RepID=UPI0030842AD3